MSRPRNVEGKDTTIKVPWSLKDRILAYQKIKPAEPGKKPHRERDDEILERIIEFYESKHPIKQNHSH